MLLGGESGCGGGAVGLIGARSPGGQDLAVVVEAIDVIFSTHLL